NVLVLLESLQRLCDRDDAEPFGSRHATLLTTPIGRQGDKSRFPDGRILGRLVLWKIDTRPRAAFALEAFQPDLPTEAKQANGNGQLAADVSPNHQKTQSRPRLLYAARTRRQGGKAAAPGATGGQARRLAVRAV